MLAGRRDRAAVAKRLQAKLDELDPQETSRFHEFNALVVELTGNQTLVLITAMLEHISQAAALSYVSRPHADDDRRLALKAHRTRQKLIDLVKAGDADGAESLWRTHLSEAGKVLAEGSGASVVDLFG
jgi:DNA-binding GntR family transcriptional regulator